MITLFSRPVRPSRGHTGSPVILVVLAALLLIIGAAVAGAAGSVLNVDDAAFTVRGTLEFAAAGAPSDASFLLAGVYEEAPEVDGLPSAVSETAFAIEVKRVTRGWLPSWVLQVTADTRAAEPIVLTPAANQQYDWAISYDAAMGVISYAVTDRVSAVTVTSGTEDVSGISGSWRLITDGAVSDSEPHYVPVAAQVQVGVRTETGAMLTTARFQGNEQPLLRLHNVGPTPRGRYSIAVEDAAGNVHIQGLTVAEGTAEISLGPLLPVGPSTVSVKYRDDAAGPVLWQQQRTVQIGAVATDFTQARRQAVNGPITTDMTLHSPADLPPVHVMVRAHVTELIWNEENKSYDPAPRVHVQPVFEDRVTFRAGESIRLPLQLPQPAVPGLYEVRWEPVFTPAVAGHITNTVSHFTTYPPATIAAGEPYTIAVFPDTQIYAMHYPDIFFRQGAWLAEVAKERNIAFALHVGDITNDNNALQWQRATAALRLMDYAVPYVLALGNHDYVPPQRPGGGQVYSRDDSIIHRYFAVADFPHLGGAMAEGRLDNTYHLFTVGDDDYVVVSLEFAPSDEAIDWANEIIAAHPRRTAIVLTHKYLRADGSPVPRGTTASYYEIAHDPTTSVNDGTDLWHKLLKRHANIRWAISGHRLTPTVPHRVTLGDAGNRVYQLLVNYQGEPEGGGGHLVLLTVQPDGTVDVEAYSPYEAVHKTDVDAYGFTNHFTVDLATGRIQRRVEP